MALSCKSQSKCENIDTLKFGKYSGCHLAKDELLPFEKFKAKAPIEHLFGFHEWCDTEWCYSREIDTTRTQLIQKTVPIAAVPPPMVNTTTSRDEVINHITTETITPAESNSVPLIAAVTALPTICTTTGGDEIVNPITTKVVAPADDKVINHITTEAITP